MLQIRGPRRKRSCMRAAPVGARCRRSVPTVFRMCKNAASAGRCPEWIPLVQNHGHSIHTPVERLNSCGFCIRAFLPRSMTVVRPRIEDPPRAVGPAASAPLTRHDGVVVSPLFSNRGECHPPRRGRDRGATRAPRDATFVETRPGSYRRTRTMCGIHRCFVVSAGRGRRAWDLRRDRPSQSVVGT